MKFESDNKMSALLVENIALIEELRHVQGTKAMLEEENKLLKYKIQMYNNKINNYGTKSCAIYALAVVILSLIHI